MQKTKAKGIYQKLQKSGEVSYCVRYYVPSEKAKSGWEQKQATFGKFQDAVNFKITRQADIKKGDYIPPVSFTIKELAEKFLEARKPRWKGQTYEGHEIQVRKYINAKFGHLRATSLRSVDVETAGAEWNKEVSYKTVNKVFTTVNAIYKFAKKLGVKNNPMLDVERLRRQTTPEELEALAEGEILDRGEDHPEEKLGNLRAIRPEEVYSAGELRKLIEAAKPGYERAFLMTAVLTGARHGELSGIRWSTVDLRKGTLFICRSLTEYKGGPVLERPKTKKAYRRLKLAPELVSELRLWKLQCPPSLNDLVFVNPRGKPVSRRGNNLKLKACCKRAGIEALSMNNLRHSFASQSLLAGVPPLKVSAMMGHSKVSTTLDIYSAWTEKEESNAEVILAGRIFNAEEQQATGSE